MATAREEMIAALWGGEDPFAAPNGLSKEDQADHQGWNSHHPYLTRAIQEARPRTVVEIGVWKGGSALTLAQALSDLGVDGAVIAVDTWLGSSEHFLARDVHGKDLKPLGGYPRLYYTFLRNVLERNLTDFVVPLPLDSVNAYHVLRSKAIRPEVLHIDAGHDFDSATSDLNAWWPVLAPGGILIGDDYFADGQIWPEVRRAFDTFFGAHHADVFEHENAKVYIKKPL